MSVVVNGLLLACWQGAHNFSRRIHSRSEWDLVSKEISGKRITSRAMRRKCDVALSDVVVQSRAKLDLNVHVIARHLLARLITR
jgi:hypothetical protein